MDAIKQLRTLFTLVTDLRTYSIPAWMRSGTTDLFEADAPNSDRDEEAILTFLEEVESRGFKVDFEIRNTRMTVSAVQA